jgi:hypothetical protein
LKLWKTMPTSWRSPRNAAGSGAGPASSVPRLASTPPMKTRPRWIASSRAMQRRSVLLPDPLGPMTTIT